MYTLPPPPVRILNRDIVHRLLTVVEILFVAFVLMNPTVIMAQGTPVVEWQHSDAPTQKPQGYSLTFDQWNGNDALYSTAAFAGATQTRDESGTDWWNAHCNLADGGYVAVGYTNYVNWQPDNSPCTMPTSIARNMDGNNVLHLERLNYRRGTTLQAIARYDADGVVQWYKTFAAGVFNDVIIDHNGQLVVTGSSPDLAASADVVLHTIYFNPTAAEPSTQETAHQCDADRERLLSVMKLNLDGTIVWDNRYSPESDIVTALDRRTEGRGLIETHLNGMYGYRVVGHGTLSTLQMRLWVVDLATGGEMTGATFHEDKVSPASSLETGNTVGTKIVRTPMSVGEYYAITGFRTIGTTGGMNRSSAFLWVLQGNQTLFFKDTHETADIHTHHSDALDQNANGICFRLVGGAPEVVWPVMADFTTDGTTRGYTSASNHQAHALVYKFNMQGLPPQNWGQPADLGVLRGFDLHFSVTPTSDGGLAFASTKWSPGYSTPSNLFGWGDLPASVQNYLNVDPNGMHFDANGPNNPGAGGFFDWETFGWVGGATIGMNDVDHAYGYWNTDSYVAKLNGTTGALLWEKQWDEGTGATATGWPGNFRRRQCMFDITEAPDRGLVVCGNEGSNFDDAYLAKLRPCDQIAEYANLPLDANGEYHITGTTTWNTDMSVKGSIVVDQGVTLSVDGAIVGFAPSTPQLTSNITVMPGATLQVRNNAMLTVVNTCSELTMWDGVKVLGTGTVVGAGLAILESGGRILNAYTALLCADADPLIRNDFDPASTGGIVQATDAFFTNNGCDVFMADQTGFDPMVYGPSFLDHCTFEVNAALNQGISKNSVTLFSSQSIVFTACIFRDTYSTANGGSPMHGPLAYNTSLRFETANNGADRTKFEGLFIPLQHASWDPSRTYWIDGADFTGCPQGIHSICTDLQRITNCTFDVPEGAGYGTYMYNSTGFEIEENAYTGHGDEQSAPEIGALYQACGPEANQFYNNTFNGFSGSSADGYSAGTVINGVNSGPFGENGLHIKCNDYGHTAPNAYDVAFTVSISQPTVTIGETQGMPGSSTSPAGNTFSLSCAANPVQHMHQNDDADLNAFTYWHHTLQPGIVELAPECNDVPVTLHDAGVQYDKEQACPTDLSGLIDVDGDLGTAGSADQEYAVLKDVYANWKDGGDTHGLVEYVMDPAHTSYEVRNQLMLVAPKVSRKAWEVAFAREPAMNPWHLAQALLANSPLEPAVLKMMEESDLTTFYKDLVTDGQDGGVSMHSIYQSEIDHFYAKKARSLFGATANVLFGQAPADKIGDIMSSLDSIDVETEPTLRLALRLATNDLQGARALVDGQLDAEPGNGYWQVQDMLLDKKEAQLPLGQVDPNEQALLGQIARSNGDGAPEALAWLDLLGESFRPEIVLPNANQRRSMERTRPAVEESPFLRAYPNPSRGQVYLVYEVPDGAEKAEVQVVDANGKLLLTRTLAPRNGILELPKLAPGLNVATLLCDGIRIGVVKLSIVK